jgi:hypothetical protein
VKTESRCCNSKLSGYHPHGAISARIHEANDVAVPFSLENPLKDAIVPPEQIISGDNPQCVVYAILRGIFLNGLWREVYKEHGPQQTL